MVVRAPFHRTCRAPRLARLGAPAYLRVLAAAETLVASGPARALLVAAFGRVFARGFYILFVSSQVVGRCERWQTVLFRWGMETTLPYAHKDEGG